MRRNRILSHVEVPPESGDPLGKCFKIASLGISLVPGGSLVKTPDTSIAAAMGSIPGRGTRIPHATWHGLTIIIIKWEDGGTPTCLREARCSQLMGQGQSRTGML